MKQKIFYYTAGPIENSNATEEVSWKELFMARLKKYKNVIGYNPVEREAEKTGKTAAANCEYIKTLKSKGKWGRVRNVMDKIWWGDFTDKTYGRLLRASTESTANEITVEEFHNLGDFPAVAASTFIVAHLPKNTKTVGTYAEITQAYFMKKPIFAICPEQELVNMNTTLIYFCLESGGGVFHSVELAANAVVEYLKGNAFV